MFDRDIKDILVTFLDGRKSAGVVINYPHWRAIKTSTRYREIRVRFFTWRESGQTGGNT